jgi:hypothetical protein
MTVYDESGMCRISIDETIDKLGKAPEDDVLFQEIFTAKEAHVPGPAIRHDTRLIRVPFKKHLDGPAIINGQPHEPLYDDFGAYKFI